MTDITGENEVLREMRQRRLDRRAEVLALSPVLREELEMLVAIALWHEEITHSRAGELLGLQNVMQVRELLSFWRAALPLLTEDEEAEVAPEKVWFGDADGLTVAGLIATLQALPGGRRGQEADVYAGSEPVTGVTANFDRVRDIFDMQVHLHTAEESRQETDLVVYSAALGHSTPRGGDGR